MSTLKELFNVDAKSTNNYEGKTVVAMVYKGKYRNGYNEEFALNSLKKHLTSTGIDLKTIEIIPMEDGRILGTLIDFEKVYYAGNININVFAYIVENYKNREEFLK